MSRASKFLYVSFAIVMRSARGAVFPRGGRYKELFLQPACGRQASIYAPKDDSRTGVEWRRLGYHRCKSKRRTEGMNLKDEPQRSRHGGQAPRKSRGHEENAPRRNLPQRPACGRRARRTQRKGETFRRPHELRVTRYESRITPRLRLQFPRAATDASQVTNHQALITNHRSQITIDYPRIGGVTVV